MVDNLRYVINMANSIIGVSILSMPYCFRQVGIALGIILLLTCGYITKKTCMFLVRSAIMSRRRSYELLAFQVFGVTGKLFMELCMILFLLGICISFHVVIGDLAPSIVAKYAQVESTSSLRATLLVGIVLLIILPLCLLRNIDSLASLSACSIGFYVFLNIVIFYTALPKLLDASWVHNVNFFHLEKSFDVLPIMLLAMACQSNVFEIYSSIPDPDIHIMESVVNHAINICCALYIGVGFLGYVAFNDKDIGGNIIMSFNSSPMTDGITMFFVISLVISFPLMLFPCRTSLYSLLYKRNVQLGFYDGVGSFMPEFRFKIITISTLVISLIIGVLIPNIEFVLGLLGSTMGMWIALLLPSVFFIRVYTKLSFDRLLAQFLLFLGVFLMFMGTYLHLMNFRIKPPQEVIVPLPTKLPTEALAINQEILNKVLPVENIKLESSDITGRKEPAIPEPPLLQEELNPNPPNDNKETKKETDIVMHNDKIVVTKPPVKVNGRSVNFVKEDVLEKTIEKNESEKKIVVVKKEVKEEDLHPDAIKKEEKENAEEKQEKEEDKGDVEKKQEEILKKLEEHQKEQVKILKVQEEILQELKDHKEKVDVTEPRADNSVPQDDNPDANQIDSAKLQNSNSVGLQENEHLSPNIANEHVMKETQVSSLSAAKDSDKLQFRNNEQLLKGRKDLHSVKFTNAKSPKQDNKRLQMKVEKHSNLHLSKDDKLNQLNPHKDLDLQSPNLKFQLKSDHQIDTIDLAPNPSNDPVKKLVQNSLSKHDEERKKRDLSDTNQPSRNKKSAPLISSKHLQSPELPPIQKHAEKSILPDTISKDPDYPGSRHLLWDQRKIRRRKRRNDQYPDYEM